MVVDHYSGWQHVADLGKTFTAKQTIRTVQTMFCFTGVPDIWYSAHDFLRDWGVEHRTSSPGYPQSSGIAEAAVKTTKRLIRRCWDRRSASIDPDKWTRAILQYRNTPTAGGRSPAQVLFGRPMCKTPFPRTDESSQLSGSVPLRSLRRLPLSDRRRWKRGQRLREGSAQPQRRKPGGGAEPGGQNVDGLRRHRSCLPEPQVPHPSSQRKSHLPELTTHPQALPARHAARLPEGGLRTRDHCAATLRYARTSATSHIWYIWQPALVTEPAEQPAANPPRRSRRDIRPPKRLIEEI